MSEVISPAEDRQPVVIVVVGRQRVGKTSFLNTTVQFLRAHGGEFVVWNADKLNRTYSLSMFSGDVLEPTRGDAEDVKAWLEDRFTHLVQHRYDAVLDIGGGDTPLAFLAQPRRLGERRLHFGLNAEVALKRLSRLLVSGEVEQPGCGVVVRAGCSWEA